LIFSSSLRLREIFKPKFYINFVFIYYMLNVWHVH
jgi:hypothetical protein